jgi:hypothetical protein
LLTNEIKKSSTITYTVAKKKIERMFEKQPWKDGAIAAGNDAVGKSNKIEQLNYDVARLDAVNNNLDAILHQPNNRLHNRINNR